MDWIDFRIETFSKQVAEAYPRLRVLDHTLLTRDVEALMRAAWKEGEAAARREHGDAIADLRARMAMINEWSAPGSKK